MVGRSDSMRMKLVAQRKELSQMMLRATRYYCLLRGATSSCLRMSMMASMVGYLRRLEGYKKVITLCSRDKIVTLFVDTKNGAHVCATLVKS